MMKAGHVEKVDHFHKNTLLFELFGNVQYIFKKYNLEFHVLVYLLLNIHFRKGQ